MGRRERVEKRWRGSGGAGEGGMEGGREPDVGGGKRRGKGPWARTRFRRAGSAGPGRTGPSKGGRERESICSEAGQDRGGRFCAVFPCHPAEVTGGHGKVTAIVTAKVTATVTDSPFSPAFPDPLPHTLAHKCVHTSVSLPRPSPPHGYSPREGHGDSHGTWDFSSPTCTHPLPRPSPPHGYSPCPQPPPPTPLTIPTHTHRKAR